MPRYGGSRKKRRTQKQEEVVDESVKDGIPRSMVFRQGRVAKEVQQFVLDFRRMMEPYTAIKLKESSTNKLRDYMHVAGPLGVTHFISIQHNDLGPTLRIIKHPKGPTFTFRVCQYSLVKDILNMQKRPHSPGVAGEYLHPPLVVLNGFSGAEHGKLMAAALQNMFPSIDVNNMALRECRRVVMFNLREVAQKKQEGDEEKHMEYMVDVRHYLIHASPVGLTRTVKKVIKGKKVPNLSKFKDMEDYIDNGQDVLSSDSEAEDGPENRVVLPQRYAGNGNVASQQSAVRLKEIGPRVRMKLIKIEEGVSSGMVLYHHRIFKTEEQIKELEKRKKEKEALKEARRLEQERNVELKKCEKESKKRKRKMVQEDVDEDNSTGEGEEDDESEED